MYIISDSYVCVSIILATKWIWTNIINMECLHNYVKIVHIKRILLTLFINGEKKDVENIFH